jgi:hypothetical protein
MALDPAMNVALKGAAPLVCLLIQLELQGYTIRSIDGTGQVVFNGETFAGDDPFYGVLEGVEPITEEIGTEAPRVRITYLPRSLAALADLTLPSNQGSPVSIWFGVVNPVTGLLIGTPELLFVGELDTADVDASETSTAITFDIASAWERLFEQSEGQRLNNSFHQSIYPGERGFEFVSLVQREEPWGYDGPRPNIVADVIGGVPGGAGGAPSTGGGVGGGGGRGGGGYRNDAL